MGTRFEIVAEGDDQTNLRAACEAALAEIEEWDARLTLFRPSSFLCYINTHAAARPVQLDDDLFELFAESLAVHHASQGAFDITLAPLMRAWGFHKQTGAVPRDIDSRGCISAGASDDTSRSSPASSGDLPRGMSDLELDADRRTIRFRREGMALDLGGIAKGHALDLAASILRESGVRCALLHGGTSTVIGINADRTGLGEDHWPVGLGVEQPGITIKLRDAAMSVSAPHGRTIEMDGTRRGHIIDPRAGAPVRRTRLAVVIAPSARLADAWSTALIVLGQRPPDMPDSLTTLIARETEDAMDWRVEGAEPELFSLKPLCGIVESEEEYD
ncbi:MAG: FAD:protein FMN transferase [Planctomycetota bacterium]|nr:FAD:protein FMN transferase [Planctomycetota bacterium]